MVETFVAVLRAARLATLDSSEALPARCESLAALSLNDCTASLTKERTLLTASSKSLIAPLSSLPRVFWRPHSRRIVQNDGIGSIQRQHALRDVGELEGFAA